MRVVVIHNTNAGERHYNSDSLVGLIRRAGHEAAYFSSKDAAWKVALHGSADLVAIAGGDGTVEEVGTANAGRRMPIAVLPLGTANNISRALGQGNSSLEDLVAGWADAECQPFDIGVARGPWGTFRFLESVGVGLLADGIAEIRKDGIDAIRHARRAEDRMAAAIEWFRQLLGGMAARPCSVSLDGRDYSGEYQLLEVLNVGVVGPNLWLAPEAEPSDGLLDLVLVGEHHRRDLADHLLLSRVHTSTPVLPVYQGRHITISCLTCNVHLDDEVWMGCWSGDEPIVIDLAVEPKALMFLVPRSVRRNAR
jgi:diacylglycerol kinase (ATP)